MKATTDLFGSYSPPNYRTEGIKYAGSKLKLLPFILDITHSVRPNRVFDGFSGTTRVSQAFAQEGYNVTSSDISIWSYVFGLCYLKGRTRSYYSELIQHLNNVKPYSGWFTEQYGNGVSDCSSRKSPWQIHNTMKLDAIRSEIEKLNLPEIDKSVALTALVIALDRVDSTIGHYSSYLREWSPRSYKSIWLDIPLIQPSVGNHEILCGDIFNTIKNKHFDLAYLDPPYGSNNEKMPPSRVRYASYYHIWKTVCLNDKPNTFGAARRREDTRDTISSSIFEEFRTNKNGDYIAVDAIRRLLDEISADHIVLSYSSGGRATAEELREAISSAGSLVEVREIDYRKNVMAGMRWTNDWVKDSEQGNKEYLFHIKK